MMSPVTIIPDSNHTAVDRLCGFALREDSSAPAVVNIRKGSAGGQILYPLIFAADSSIALMFSTSFVSCEDGVYIEEVSGSIEGTIYQSV